MLRGIGGGMILAGCLGLGISYRVNLMGRIRLLQQLTEVLELLESEIRYGQSTLPESCFKAGKKLDNRLGRVLQEIGRETCESGGESFPRIFRERMEQAIGERGFKREDRENFFRFIPREGFSDEKMQLRAVEGCRERLEKTRERLEREGAEKSRIAVGLGAMSGLLLILVLW